MYFISALVVINLSFLYCFGFFQHRGMLELKSDLKDTNEDAKASEEWIYQRIDHFDANNKNLWKMRYFKRLTFFKPTGPILLFIGGFEMNPVLIERNSLFTCQLAKETNGALFASEHRYYGKSMPVEITDTSSMKYLSSKQALADLAVLIKTIKSALEFQSSKVVVIGGAYAGNLAAWMRLLYPDLVNAALSSSAPVLAKTNFDEYLEAVADTYKRYGSEKCVDKINELLTMITYGLSSSAGRREIKKMFRICKLCDMTDEQNQKLFLDSLITFVFKYNAAYHHPDDIEQQCHYIVSENLTHFHDYLSTYQHRFASHYGTSKNNTDKSDNITLDGRCLDFNYTRYIDYMTENRKEGFAVWNYQFCTEFGHFETTDSKDQPFGSELPLDYFIRLCQDLFGKDFDENRVDTGVEQTNAMYGGITPKVSNVVFTHGDMDPWNRLGILKDLSHVAVVRITNGTSNSAMLYWDYNIPETLVRDREFAKDAIKKFLYSPPPHY